MIKLKKYDEIDIWSGGNWIRCKYVRKYNGEISVIELNSMEYNIKTDTIRMLSSNNPNVTFKKEI